jgi:hypothetical protein
MDPMDCLRPSPNLSAGLIKKNTEIKYACDRRMSIEPAALSDGQDIAFPFLGYFRPGVDFLHERYPAACRKFHLSGLQDLQPIAMLVSIDTVWCF